MGFWERVQWGIWKVQAFFGNEDAAIHADSLEQVVLANTPIDREINTIVDSEVVEGPRVPIFSDMKDALENTFKGISGLTKNLPLYILLIIVFLGVYVLLMGRKGKAII